MGPAVAADAGGGGGADCGSSAAAARASGAAAPLLLQALQTLYSSTDSTERHRADLWLRNWQKTPEAWEVSVHLLLQDLEQRQQQQQLEGLPDEAFYFLAQTLRSKIMFDFYELPSHTHETLCTQVLRLLQQHLQQEEEKVGSSSSNSSSRKAAVVQLSLCLADLALQTAHHWRSPVETILQACWPPSVPSQASSSSSGLSAAAAATDVSASAPTAAASSSLSSGLLSHDKHLQRPRLLLLLLQHLAEERGNRRVLVDEETRGQHHRNLAAGSLTVAEALLQLREQLQHQRLARAAAAATAAAGSAALTAGDALLLQQLFACWRAWLPLFLEFGSSTEPSTRSHALQQQQRQAVAAVFADCLDVLSSPTFCNELAAADEEAAEAAADAASSCVVQLLKGASLGKLVARDRVSELQQQQQQQPDAAASADAAAAALAETSAAAAAAESLERELTATALRECVGSEGRLLRQLQRLFGAVYDASRRGSAAAAGATEDNCVGGRQQQQQASQENQERGGSPSSSSSLSLSVSTAYAWISALSRVYSRLGMSLQPSLLLDAHCEESGMQQLLQVLLLLWQQPPSPQRPHPLAAQAHMGWQQQQQHLWGASAAGETGAAAAALGAAVAAARSSKEEQEEEEDSRGAAADEEALIREEAEFFWATLAEKVDDLRRALPVLAAAAANAAAADSTGLQQEAAARGASGFEDAHLRVLRLVLPEETAAVLRVQEQQRLLRRQLQSNFSDGPTTVSSAAAAAGGGQGQPQSAAAATCAAVSAAATTAAAAVEAAAHRVSRAVETLRQVYVHLMKACLAQVLLPPWALLPSAAAGTVSFAADSQAAKAAGPLLQPEAAAHREVVRQLLAHCARVLTPEEALLLLFAELQEQQRRLQQLLQQEVAALPPQQQQQVKQRLLEGFLVAAESILLEQRETAAALPGGRKASPPPGEGEAAAALLLQQQIHAWLLVAAEVLSEAPPESMENVFARVAAVCVVQEAVACTAAAAASSSSPSAPSGGSHNGKEAAAAAAGGREDEAEQQQQEQRNATQLQHALHALVRQLLLLRPSDGSDLLVHAQGEPRARAAMQKLQSTAAWALREICCCCSSSARRGQPLLLHIDAAAEELLKLHEILVARRADEDLQILVLEGVATVTSQIRNTEAFLRTLEFLCRPLIQGLSASAAEQQQQYDACAAVCWQLDCLAIVLRDAVVAGVLPSNSSSSSSSSSSSAAEEAAAARRSSIAAFVTETLWPLLLQQLQQQPDNQRIVEKSLRCLKHAVRCAGMAFTPQLPLLLQLLQTNAQRKLHCTYLYAAEWLAMQYAGEEAFQEPLLRMFQQLSLQALDVVEKQRQSGGGVDECCDIIEDCYGMLNRFTRYCPALVAVSPHVVRQALLAAGATMYVQERKAVEAVFIFLDSCVLLCEPQNARDQLSAALQPTIEEILPYLVEECFRLLSQAPSNEVLRALESFLATLLQSFRWRAEPWIARGIAQVPVAALSTEAMRTSLLEKLFKSTYPTQPVREMISDIAYKCRQIAIRNRA